LLTSTILPQLPNESSNGRFRSSPVLRQSVHQIVEVNWFGDVSIHSGLETFFQPAIASAVMAMTGM
jgi:hypothetical protein